MKEQKEHHCLGPPGTGKTTWLSRQVERACEEHDPQFVMVASFTRAAVAELNRRDLPIPEQNLGTLHALAYRALGHPEICETGKFLKEWSEEYPRYAMSSGTREGVDDGFATGCDGEGDALLMEYSRLRALQRDRSYWAPRVTAFAAMWEAWKKETDRVDFTDLIEKALQEVDRPTCYPMIGFFDEVQDFTPLEIALVRKWAQTMEQVVLCYDLDQSIYAFKGADPSVLYDPSITPMVLKQSYRLPRVVQSAAEKLIGQIGPEYRFQREYLPREEEGAVEKVGQMFSQPERLIEQAAQYAEQGKSVLFLSTCSYMLNPLLTRLREQGIPFSNPYRRRRRDWNPLLKVKNQQNAATRVAAFLAAFWRSEPQWTVEELYSWLDLTKGVAKRGWKEKAALLPKDTYLPIVNLLGIIDMDAILAAHRGKGEWLRDNLSAQWRGTGTFAIKCAERNELALHEEPLIMTGTIHSVKGGEADVVFLSPDLSPQGFSQLTDHNVHHRHAVVRQMYVGVTRAREKLILCAPSTRISFPEWV